MNVFTFLTIISIILGWHFEKLTCDDTPFKLLSKHKGTIKTYKNEYGDIFDCVNIYQQPSFAHPLLKNHTIQKHLTTNIYKNAGCYSKKFNLHNAKNSSYICPKETIPIIRSEKHSIKIDQVSCPEGSSSRQYAFLETKKGSHRIFGATGLLDICNPHISQGREYSLAQISIVSGKGSSNYTSIEAGWIRRRLDSLPIFFIRSTDDGYKTENCINMECAGFVQTNSEVEIGGTLPASGSMIITIYKDDVGNWILEKDCEQIGYWNHLFFPALEYGAEQIIIGGEILKKKHIMHKNRATQMGNGRYGSEGEDKAAAIDFIQQIQQDGTYNKLSEFQITMSHPKCFKAYVISTPNDNYSAMYYGGPGVGGIIECGL